MFEVDGELARDVSSSSNALLVTLFSNFCVVVELVVVGFGEPIAAAPV